MWPSSLFSSIAAVTCYADNLSVIALEAREVEDIFMLATTHLDEIKAFSSGHPVMNAPSFLRIRVWTC